MNPATEPVPAPADCTASVFADEAIDLLCRVGLREHDHDRGGWIVADGSRGELVVGWHAETGAETMADAVAHLLYTGAGWTTRPTVASDGILHGPGRRMVTGRTRLRFPGAAALHTDD